MQGWPATAGAAEAEENSLLELKAAEFASPAIKTTLTNTNVESVQHKHQEEKKLLTNTLALGINHMHAQTNSVQKHRLSQQIEGWQTSLSSAHNDSEYNDSWRAAAIYERSDFPFSYSTFPKRLELECAGHVLRDVNERVLVFLSAQAFIFAMIKVRSCKVNDNFSTVEFCLRLQLLIN